MLAKENRISKKKEIDQFFGLSFKKARGFSFSTKSLLVKALDLGEKVTRAGFVVANKVDNRATVRNRIKRQLRETIQENLGLLRPLGLLVLAQSDAKKLTKPEIKAELLEMLKKMRLFK